MSLLSAINLGRKIQSRWVWRGVNLVLSPGMCLGLVGATGTGKTLLMRALAGLDPINEGEIKLGNRSLTQCYIPQYRSLVIYLHQRSVLLEGTVETNLKRIYDLSVHHQKYYSYYFIKNHIIFLHFHQFLYLFRFFQFFSENLKNVIIYSCPYHINNNKGIKKYEKKYN